MSEQIVQKKKEYFSAIDSGSGSAYQHEHVIDSSSMVFFVKYYLTSGVKVVGKEAIITGVHVLDDIGNSGTTFKQAVSRRSRKSGENLKRKTARKILEIMTGWEYKPGGKKTKALVRQEPHSSVASKTGEKEKDEAYKCRKWARA